MKSSTTLPSNLEAISSLITNYRPGFSQTKGIVEEKCKEYLAIQKVIAQLKEQSSHIQSFLETQTLVPLDEYEITLKEFPIEKLAPLPEFLKKGFTMETLLHKNLIQSDTLKKFVVVRTVTGEQETKQ